MPELNEPFPHAERRTLKSPPIELIIGQVRYPTVAKLFSDEGYIAFAERISERFPDAEARQEVQVEVSPDGTRERARTSVWKFEDLDRRWTVTLTPVFLALETRQYESFTDFRDTFVQLWSDLSETHGIRHRTRLGLRYVDRVSAEKQKNLPANWLDMIASEAIPLRRRLPKATSVSKIEHRFRLQDGLWLTYRATCQRLQGENGAIDEFTLDLDAYDESREEMLREASERLDVLKELSHNAFWWTLGRLLNEIDPPC